jgi:hypothetical protein
MLTIHFISLKVVKVYLNSNAPNPWQAGAMGNKRKDGHLLYSVLSSSSIFIFSNLSTAKLLICLPEIGERNVKV